MDTFLKTDTGGLTHKYCAETSKYLPLTPNHDVIDPHKKKKIVRRKDVDLNGDGYISSDELQLAFNIDSE